MRKNAGGHLQILLSQKEMFDMSGQAAGIWYTLGTGRRL